MAEGVLLLRVVQSIAGLVGIAGNFLVCLVIWRVKMMHTMSNAFIFNQALVDLLASLLLLLISNIELPASLPGLAGLLLCYLWVTRFFLWSCFSTSTYNLMALTVERYVAIVFPFKYQVYFSARLAGGLIATSWVCGFATSVANLVWVVYSEANGTCLPYVLPDPPVIGTFVHLQVNFLLPACVMGVAYTHIILTLKRSARRVAPTTRDSTNSCGAETAPSAENTLEGSLERAKRNTIKTLFLVFIVYVICWAPNTAVFSLFLLGVPVDLNGPVYILSLVLVVCNSCANPIVYGLKYRQFRKGVKILFGRSSVRPADTGIVISTTTGRNM